MHKISQIRRGKRVFARSAQCEKLFVKTTPNPLPLPTLKLSDPPGAVRPDGNLTTPSPDLYAYRKVTSKLKNLKVQ
jgi:hypothetical protein